MSSIASLKIAVSNNESNINHFFASTVGTEPQDIIFDVDGTLADVSHRQHFVKDSPKDWDAFYGAMVNDRPNPPVVMIAHLLKAAGHRIIIATGRPLRYQMVTRAFLDDIAVSYDAIYFRKDKDYRKDTQVKEHMLLKMRQDGFDPTIVFDDRKSVVEMWRLHDLFVFQVAEGDF